MFSYKTFRKALFLFQPETAHDIVSASFQILPRWGALSNYLTKKYFVEDERLSQDIFNIKFPNPVGLAAGFDKNGTMIKSMAAFGFGYTEIGTVTPRPQMGNAKPRMFRYEKQNSIQNAMGFNNVGAHTVLKNLKKIYPFVLPVGVNIGKNKTTPKKYALNDYKVLIKKFEQLCDYLVVNISSPNTPNLRDLQNEEFISSLFEMGEKLTKKPILLKIAPDIEPNSAINLCKKAINSGAAGIIATNTTVDYGLLPGCKSFGGLSGEILREKSYELFKNISKEIYGKTLLISVGGISDGKEAYRRIKAGASLVQLYSGMIFEGTSIVKNINKNILKLMKKDGYNNIKEAIGADLK